MHNELAHTAEHAFIGSLQKLIGMTLEVRKVDHRDNDSVVFVGAKYLDAELIAKAQSEVNVLIVTGRKVFTHSFSSLTKAKEQFQSLRANEARIKEDEPVKVVEIYGEHVKDMTSCGLVLVTRVSKTEKEYEINFVVGEQARQTAMDLSLRLVKISGELGANINTLESTIKKLKKDNERYLRNLKTLTRERLRALTPNNIVTNHTQDCFIIKGVFSGLLDTEIRSFAAKKIGCDNTIVILANKIDDSEQNLANIVFARSPSIAIDCGKLFRNKVPAGKGGGKPDFFTGIVNGTEVHDAVTLLTSSVLHAISDTKLIST
ncbi:MAG: hypothetical protein WBQ25_04900 [Nitrososphaeraceae archaeon]